MLSCRAMGTIPVVIVQIFDSGQFRRANIGQPAREHGVVNQGSHIINVLLQSCIHQTVINQLADGKQYVVPGCQQRLPNFLLVARLETIGGFGVKNQLYD